jgi:hypothetical protein
MSLPSLLAAWNITQTKLQYLCFLIGVDSTLWSTPSIAYVDHIQVKVDIIAPQSRTGIRELLYLWPEWLQKSEHCIWTWPAIPPPPQESFGRNAICTLSFSFLAANNEICLTGKCHSCQISMFWEMLIWAQSGIAQCHHHLSTLNYKKHQKNKRCSRAAGGLSCTKLLTLTSRWLLHWHEGTIHVLSICVSATSGKKGIKEKQLYLLIQNDCKIVQ